MSSPIPITFADFLRVMRTACNPNVSTADKFEKACEAMWFDGDLSPQSITEHVGCSKPTAVKWCRMARQVGITPGQMRARSAKHEKLAEELRDKSKSMSVTERRDYYVSLMDALVEQHKDNPREIGPLIDRLTTLIPGLKAPEVRVDVQLALGRGAEDRLFTDLRENLAFAMNQDRSLASELLSSIPKPELAKLLSAVPLEAEVVEDEDVDDGADPDHSLQPGDRT